MTDDIYQRLGPTMNIGLILAFQDTRTGNTHGWSDLPAMTDRPPIRDRLETLHRVVGYWLNNFGSQDPDVVGWDPIAVNLVDMFEVLNAAAGLMLQPATVEFCETVHGFTDDQLEEFTAVVMTQNRDDVMQARKALRRAGGNDLRTDLGVRLASQEGARIIRYRLRDLYNPQEPTAKAGYLFTAAGDIAAAVAFKDLIGDDYTSGHYNLLISPYRAVNGGPMP